MNQLEQNLCERLKDFREACDERYALIIGSESSTVNGAFWLEEEDDE